MAIIRQVSSETAQGLSTEIAKAYEDGLGFNDEGVAAQVGGVAETAQLNFSWPHGRAEVTEVMTLDITNINLGIPYTGNPGTGSSRRYGFTNVTEVNAQSIFYLTVSIGGVSVTGGDISSGSLSASQAAAGVRNILLDNSFNSIRKNTTLDGVNLTLELFYSVGDAQLSVVVHNASSGRSTTVSPSNTVVTPYSTPTPERTLILSSSNQPNPQNATIAGAKLPEESYVSIAIPGGAGGLSSSEVTSHLEDLYSSIDGVSASISGNTLTANFDSGYATKTFRLSVVLENTGSSRLFGVDFPGTITTEYVHPTAEAHGTMHFTIKKPAVGSDTEETFTVPIRVPETQSALQLEELIKTSILEYVTNEETGSTVSDFLSISTETSAQTTVGLITFENFAVNLDWGLGGRVSGSVPAASQFVDETTLVGETGATSTYVGTIDINSAVDGTTYTIISAGNASVAQLRSFAGVTSGTISVGDRVTATNVSSLSDLTATVNQFVGGDSSSVSWDLFSTSSVLQPGGETTHFATLIKV